MREAGLPTVRDVAVSSRQAARRLERVLERTPTVRSTWLSRELNAEVWLKLENRQLTGSFKARGAANKLLRLSKAELVRGVVTASTGNHGLAVTAFASQLGAPVCVWAPRSASAAKIGELKRFGAEVVVHGDDAVAAEMAARSSAEARGQSFVSPYNDLDVIAGQGSVGIELVDDMQTPADAVFVAVGGGGLVAGVSAVLKAAWPETVCYGCSPENSPVMARCVEAGKVFDVPVRPTLSDATAGGLEPGSVTLGLCQVLVDQWVLIDEATIDDVQSQFEREHDEQIEGAAAVAVAGAMARARSGQTIVIVICGGNR